MSHVQKASGRDISGVDHSNMPSGSLYNPSHRAVVPGVGSERNTTEGLCASRRISRRGTRGVVPGDSERQAGMALAGDGAARRPLACGRLSAAVEGRTETDSSSSTPITTTSPTRCSLGEKGHFRDHNMSQATRARSFVHPNNVAQGRGDLAPSGVSRGRVIVESASAGISESNLSSSDACGEDDKLGPAVPSLPTSKASFPHEQQQERDKRYAVAAARDGSHERGRACETRGGLGRSPGKIEKTKSPIADQIAADGTVRDDAYQSTRCESGDTEILTALRGVGSGGELTVNAMALLLLAAGSASVDDAEDDSSRHIFHGNAGNAPLCAPSRHLLSDNSGDGNGNSNMDSNNRDGDRKRSTACIIGGEGSLHERRNSGGTVSPAGRGADGYKPQHHAVDGGGGIGERGRGDWRKSSAEGMSREQKCIAADRNGGSNSTTYSVNVPLLLWEEAAKRRKGCSGTLTTASRPSSSVGGGNTEDGVGMARNRKARANSDGATVHNDGGSHNISRVENQFRNERDRVGGGGRTSSGYSGGAKRERKLHRNKCISDDSDLGWRAEGDPSTHMSAQHAPQDPLALRASRAEMGTPLERLPEEDMNQPDVSTTIGEDMPAQTRRVFVVDKPDTTTGEKYTNDCVGRTDNDDKKISIDGNGDTNGKNDGHNNSPPTKRRRPSAKKSCVSPAHDNGAGIDQLTLRRVCDRFTKKKTGCSGGQPCGLPSRRGLVRVFSGSHKQLLSGDLSQQSVTTPCRNPIETAGETLDALPSDHASSDGTYSDECNPPKRRKRGHKLVWSQFRKACDRCTDKKRCARQDTFSQQLRRSGPKSSCLQCETRCLQIRCDRGNPSGKVKACTHCKRAGQLCLFGICRRSGPRDAEGHKTAAAGVIMKRDDFEKVTGRLGSCRTDVCLFAHEDGSFRREHFHCRIGRCSFAGKNMSALLLHRDADHHQSAVSDAFLTSEAVGMPSGTSTPACYTVEGSNL